MNPLTSLVLCTALLLSNGVFAQSSGGVIWAEPTGLSEQEARETIERVWAELAEEIAESPGVETRDQIEAGKHELRIKERTFGDAPFGERSLWISLHGGGGTTAQVNDQQWANQIRLYEPAEGLYVAPRAPTDTWNLWHQPHVDVLLDALITEFIATRGVDPDRVYLMGYSAGGDGVYQLGPRMADRFAAAAMMAGHPNDAKPDSLRNLPFAIFMGGKDSAFNRNSVAAQWGERLAALSGQDPAGYQHLVKIYPEHGHWMNGEDREAVPWMAAQTRDAWPERVVWVQDDVTHSRFYWLSVAEPKRGTRIEAFVDAQTISITSDDVSELTVLLHDDLIDLDRPVRVIANGRVVHDAIVRRTESAITDSLNARADPRAAATASLSVSW